MENPERVQNLLAGASELPREQRAAYLEAGCHGDAALRADVESLLRSHDEAGRFLASPTGEAPVFSGSRAATMAAPIREGPGTRIGPYKLLQLIGEGGFGSVFMAEQERPVSRKVALKIIKLGMDTKAVIARFEAERQALALMDHPNIARVLDAGATDTGRPYFVMELCKGEAIVEYCDKHNASIHERLDLFAQVCAAVQHAHTKGIIHRDIKPSNVLVSTQDGRPHTKVIDFGIAKATASKLTEKTLFTEHRALIGTPEYMSPEQAEGSLDIDTRTDVYSLGVLLYELLTGTTPFSSQELRSAAYGEIQRIIREVEPPKPSTRLSHNTDTLASVAARRHTEPKKLGTIIRGDLDWIVMKALEKDRQRRYESANGLAEDIRRYLSHQPVSAGPPGLGYRVRKFVRRNRVAVVAASLVAIALVLGVIGTTGGMVWAIDQKGRAELAEKEASDQRDLAQDHLYESLLGEADAIREGRRLGYREQVVARLQRAAAIPTAKRDWHAIRTEASRCLGDGIGLEPVNLPDVAVDTSALAINPNGSSVALGNVDGSLTIRDGRSGMIVASFTVQGRFVDLRFAGSGDRLFGQVQLPTPAPVASPPMSIAEWRRSGQGVWAAHSTRPEPDFAALFDTPRGAAIAREDRTRAKYRISFLETGEEIGAVSRDPVAISPDYSRVAMRQHNDDQIFLKDMQGDGPERALDLGGIGGPNRAMFNDDGSYLACWGPSGITVIDPAHAERVCTLRGYFAEPRFVDRTTLAVAAPQTQTVRLFNIASGWEVATLKMPANHVDIARDSGALVGVGDTSAAVVHIGDTPERRHLRGHVGGVTAVEFSPDGTLLASIGKDQTIRLWDTKTGTPLRTLGGEGGLNQGLTFSPDGRFLAAASSSALPVVLWSLRSFRPVLVLDESPPGYGAVYACSFSPDGRYLAASGTCVRLWELTWPPAEGRPDAPPAAKVIFRAASDSWGLKFDDESHRLYYGDSRLATRTTYMVSLGSDAPVAEQLVNVKRGGMQVLDCAHRDGLFACTTRDLGITLWDGQSGEAKRELATLLKGELITGIVRNQRFSPDGTLVAVANGTGRGVNVVEVATGRRVLALPDESGSVWWLAWSPDSTLLVVARSEGDISIWDVPVARAVLTEARLDQGCAGDAALR